MMKKLALLSILATVSLSLVAQNPVFTDCRELNIIGKLVDASNPYHRVDTAIYKGLNKNEIGLGISAAGLAVAFRTDSRSVWVRGKIGHTEGFDNSTGFTQRGYDLYCLRDGKWIWTAATADKPGRDGGNLKVAGNLDEGMKNFILYLPLYSELVSLELGVDAGSVLEKWDDPFKFKVAVYGSSFTQGACTTRSGLSYPQILSRRTGILFANLGMDGNCKMQPQFAQLLKDCDADAFLFDVFSNGTTENFEERIFPFIETIQSAHPGKPLIFQQTIQMQRNNLRSGDRDSWSKRMARAAELVKEAQEKYDNIYFITPDPCREGYDTGVDGIHPNDAGYAYWADSIEKKVLRILARYGIRR